MARHQRRTCATPSCRCSSTLRGAWGSRTPTAARRIDRARDLVDQRPAAGAVIRDFTPECSRFGDRLATADAAGLAATDRRTSLGGGAAGGARSLSRTCRRGHRAAHRRRGQRRPRRGGRSVGRSTGVRHRHRPAAVSRDREVVSVTAAESVLATRWSTSPSRPWRTATAGRRSSCGCWRTAGQSICGASRPRPTACPSANGFHVSPNRDAPTVYTVEIPAAAGRARRGEQRPQRAGPAAGARRGASCSSKGRQASSTAFSSGAWAGDRGLEIDSVVRKGRDDSGADTFYVQAAQSRADALHGRLPANARRALRLRRRRPRQRRRRRADKASSSTLTRAFVGERGGGLLVLGARAFQHQGLRDTPLEDVAAAGACRSTGAVVQAARLAGREPRRADAVGGRPSGHAARRRRPTRTQAVGGGAAAGVRSPLWAAPGLARACSPSPAGRAARRARSSRCSATARAASMVFTGEAAWRWRMMLPSTDHSYDRFWRQAVRWLAQATPEPVALTLPAAPATGDGMTMTVDARDRRLRAAARRGGRRARDVARRPRRCGPGRGGAVGAGPLPSRRSARRRPASTASRPTRGGARRPSARRAARCSSAASIRR